MERGWGGGTEMIENRFYIYKTEIVNKNFEIKISGLSVLRTEYQIPVYFLSQHQMFWMNEKDTKGPDYWKQSNFANCLLDMLLDTVQLLKGGKISNYFDEKINILAGKERKILNELAVFLQSEWDKLIHV